MPSSAQDRATSANTCCGERKTCPETASGQDLEAMRTRVASSSEGMTAMIESGVSRWPGLIGDNERVQVAILGPLEVRNDGGEPVVISGARLRDLITRLALAGGRPVSTSALAEAVWGQEPPADLVTALQQLV